MTAQTDFTAVGNDQFRAAPDRLQDAAANQRVLLGGIGANDKNQPGVTRRIAKAGEKPPPVQAADDMGDAFISPRGGAADKPSAGPGTGPGAGFLATIPYAPAACMANARSS